MINEGNKHDEYLEKRGESSKDSAMRKASSRRHRFDTGTTHKNAERENITWARPGTRSYDDSLDRQRRSAHRSERRRKNPRPGSSPEQRRNDSTWYDRFPEDRPLGKYEKIQKQRKEGKPSSIDVRAQKQGLIRKGERRRELRTQAVNAIRRAVGGGYVSEAKVDDHKKLSHNIRDFERIEKTFEEFMIEAYLILEKPYQIYGPDPHGPSDAEPKPLGKPYQNKKRAKNRADKLDQEIGGYRHFVRKVDEEFKDLTPEKEQRVMRRMGELAKDVLDSHEKAIKLRNKPFAKHRPGVRRMATELLKNAKKKQRLAQNATDAISRTDASRRATNIHKQNQLKQQLRDLGADPDAPDAKSNIRRFRREEFISLKTSSEFLEVLSEKKKDKRVTRGVVVKPKNVSSYNLNDYPEPKETKPGSPERMEQIKKILDNGAKRFKS